MNRQFLGQDFHLLDDDAFHGAPKRRPFRMANGSLSALGLGGALDLRDEAQARALAFVDRIQLERLDFELVNSLGPILPHLIRTPPRQGAWRPV